MIDWFLSGLFWGWVLGVVTVLAALGYRARRYGPQVIEWKGRRGVSKVYLVTQGCYSDYEVVAAFTKQEDAEKFAGALNDGSYGDDAQVEEYDLDPEVPAVRCYYAATVNYKGEVVEKGEFWARPGSRRTQARVYTVWTDLSDVEDGGVRITRRTEIPLLYACSDRSLEEAIKSARDRLVQWKGGGDE